ncbi:hypothetical protein BOTNAR_0051g00120 [Botryotinia narcissicola]|uniref:Fungal N-terminal domain-containing protein n=1 Tax=Botryotinia narcissicola TaxID=278944 RepID=A0A4Z1J5V0_9HELO|nr:hypothetical protein BOTNAR_0051g00120 [Botryotinia narcissicola]
MALEVIGGIASILQLAGTVYTISKTLYEVGEALSNAPSDIKDLARDLETFSDELHLLSTLLHGKDGRYADQVYRLTAKIIGDCATICTKIDRIIRKLRGGSVLAKIKWLYKEKEIMKLLARLRDLKLSLMGTLSVLSALRADNMMDSLGINNRSMIGGPNRDGLSTETRMQVEDTRLKLAGMSMKDTIGASLGSKHLLPSSASLVSGGSSSTLGTSATSSTYVSPPAIRTPSTSSFSTPSFISMTVVPKSMPPILNTHANQSVDSFHSALSYQNRESLDGRMKQVESFVKPEDLNDIPVIPQSVVVSDRHDKPSFSAEERHQLSTSESESLKGWRNEMVLSAMNHFNMNLLDAEEWAKHLPVPSNISATTRPTDQAETSPHPEVENKPQEIEHGKVCHGYQGESTSQYEYYEALERESFCEIPDLLNFMPEMGYIPSAIHSPASPEHILVESDSAKSQNHQINAFLGSSMGRETSFGGFGDNGPRMEEFDGYSASPAYSPASPVYSFIEADGSSIQAGTTLLSSAGGKKCPNNSTAVQTWPSHGTPQQHQKLQSSIQQTQRIQMQQQQQIQQQMVRLSPHRRLGVTERVTGVDSGRWHNFDACLSIEISANMPSVLHGVGTENLLPKTQPQEVQMLNRASQETYTRGGQPSYPSISPYGKSEPRGRMELPPDYTDDLSGQVFKSPKIDRSNNDSTLNFQNEVSNKGPGGFWVRGFINVKSLNAVIWSNLEQYLKWQRVYATSEAGSIPLVANSDWSANIYKERIALRRQMFPRAASCIQKILDVLAVMEETIGLKTGAIAWACLLGAVENLLSYGTNWTVDSQTKIITEMSEIASIIARYTVMENIYSQWKGMSLDKDYEQSLINLSTHVLIYLGAFVPSLSESSTNAHMKPYFEKIIEADMACRGFTVIVSSNNNAIDRKRLFEEFSDDSDDTVDSDGTILGVDGNDEVNDTPSSAKRTRI